MASLDKRLDGTTVQVLSAWRAWQQTEQAVVGAEPKGWVVANAAGGRSIPTQSRRHSRGS